MSPLTGASKVTIVYIQLVYVTTYRSLKGPNRIYAISVCHHLQEPHNSRSYIQLAYVTTYRSLEGHDSIYTISVCHHLQEPQRSRSYIYN